VEGRLRWGRPPLTPGGLGGLLVSRLLVIGLTPGNLIIHLRKLEEAGYLSSDKTGNGSASRTTVALTGHGRAALDSYTQALRDLLGGL
jgi:DNA-binding MarR family transcriptional regulator